MSTITSKKAWAALVVAHMCGVIDLAALPIWVGTLISGYGFEPAQAGALASLFLFSAVVCSLIIAPQYHRLNGRWLAPGGFWVAAFCFLMMAQTDVFSVLAILHVIAGGGIGVAMSYTAGSMGKTSNPHRVFALGGVGLSLAAIIYLAVTPILIRETGPSALFWVFAIIMTFAALFTSAFFPSNPIEKGRRATGMKFVPAAWFVIFGIMSLSINQSMVLSFAERVGADSGYASGKVQLALVAMTFTSLLAPIMAGFLQHKVSPVVVGICVACLQACLAFSIMTSVNFSMYFAAVLIYPFIMVFGHIFMFGLLAKIEPSGRAVAATPVMAMGGSAIGPILGGVLVQTSGYQAVGIAGVAIGLMALILFLRAKALT